MLCPLSVFATDTICPAGYQPAEYVELEYIEFTGDQWFDTGLYGTQNTTVDIVAQSTDAVATNNRILFGSRTAYQRDAIAFFLNGSNGNIVIDFYAARMINAPDTYNKKWHLYNSKDYRYAKTSDEMYEDYTNVKTTFTTPVTMLMGTFGYNTPSGSLNFKGKLFSEQITEGDILVQDLIPAKRNSDNEIGMYDLVTGQFFNNQGTGKFIAGPEKTDKKYITDENSDIVCEMCPANTYKPNAGNTECTECPENTFSPVGSKELGDCAKILRVKDYVVYMPLGKRTEHGLCVMSDGKKYCADVYERQ